MARSVCIIPARGNSRRIPGKNIGLFHGKPIIAYSIDMARESTLFDDVYVSTDDETIGTAARGASVINRPPHLAGDEVGTQEVMRHALRTITLSTGKRYDIACCLYATAPLLQPVDLAAAWARLHHDRLAYCYMPGQFYLGHTWAFLGGLPLTACSFESRTNYPDINEPEDWARAEAMYAALHP